MLIGRISSGSDIEGRLSNPSPRYIEGDHVYKHLRKNEYSTVTNTLVSSIDYTVTDSLAFNGTQYIVTDFKPTNNTRIEIDFKRTDTSGQKFLFGSRSADKQFTLGYYSTTVAYPMFGSTTGSLSDSGATANEIHTASLGQDGYYLDGECKKNFDTMNFTGIYNLYIGATNLAADVDSRMFVGEIYAVRLYESEELVHEFLPAEGIQGEVGLYDLINSRFYQRQTN